MLLQRTDILTPLPAMGVDFEIIPGKGPKIPNPVLTKADIDAIKPLHDVEKQVPFLGNYLYQYQEIIVLIDNLMYAHTSQ